LSGCTDYSACLPIVTKIYRNDRNLGFTDAGIPLIGVADSSFGWGDYDNDGDLDILLTGSLDTSGTRITRLYRNNTITPNIRPTEPTNLVALVSGNSITLSWSSASDPETPVTGLTHNLRLGSVSGGSQIISPMANTSNGLRLLPAIGNSGYRRSVAMKNLVAGMYFWSVQAIDSSLAGSAFATEGIFSIVTPPSQIALFGPVLTTPGTSSSFDAAISPITATLPITYVWQTTGQTPVVHADSLTYTDTENFAWDTTGTQIISVTAINAGGIVTATHEIIVKHLVYLPIIVQRWPPVPYAPILAAIDNADGDGNYTVSWAEQPSQLADTYTLQEATNAAFTIGVRDVCTTSQTTCTVTGKLAGVYYYRVRGLNNWGYGEWSNLQTANAIPVATPLLYAIDNPDQDNLYVVSWSSVTGAISYTLEQDTTPGFSKPVALYPNTQISKEILLMEVPGTYYYRVRAHGNTGPGTWSNTQSVWVGRVEVIRNGGFESGERYWFWSPDPTHTLTSNKFYHLGVRSARLGVNNNTYDELSTDISIPANATSATLSYWRMIRTTDVGGTAYDMLWCDANNNLGVSIVCGEFSNTDQSSGWIKQTVDLLPLRGATGTIDFSNHNDGSYPTEFFIDDISIVIH
jgi:hypothetical protein